MPKFSAAFPIVILVMFFISPSLLAKNANNLKSSDTTFNQQKTDNDEKNDKDEHNENKEEAEDVSLVSNKKAKKNSEDTTNDQENTEGKNDDKKTKIEPPKVGNFSLPTSQQPAALFGFGGNIIDKDEIQFYFFGDDFVGKRKTITDLIPSILFGITDEWSVFFNTPFSPLMIDGCFESQGAEDFFMQFEYAFYTHSTINYVDQATLVANLTFPTGSIRKLPPTGFGSPSFFLGGTFYRTWIDWFVFTSNGGILTSSEHGTKIGDQFLYQMGFGRNFPSPEGWIYSWMIEVDGQYSKKNRVKGTLDNNSGGNVIYVTPSIWISSKELILQFGVSVPVNQNLFGIQNKVDYALNLNFSWSFYP